MGGELCGAGGELCVYVGASGGPSFGSGPLLDSGANAHFTGDRSVVFGHSESVLGVVGLGGSLRTESVGRARVCVGGASMELDNVYYVPGLDKTIISVSCLVEAGYSVSAQRDARGVNCMVVSRGDEEVFRVAAHGGLYSLGSEGLHAWGSVAELGELLHRRFGHTSWANGRWARRVREAYRPGVGEGCTNLDCEACMRAKMHKGVSREQPTRPATRPLERLLIDFSPSVPVQGVGGQTGFLLIVDEFTRYWSLHCVRQKSEVRSILSDFKAGVEKHFSSKGHKVECVRSDGENVLNSKEIDAWCRSDGIRHEVSAPYSQWQNGIVERAIGLAWEGGEALRKQAGAPPRYWPFSLLAFAFTRNRLALGDDDRSPHEMWWSVTLPLKERTSILRVWGSKCYSYVDPACRRKLDDKGRVCAHLGYSPTTKGYWLVDLDTGKFFTAAASSCRFDELSFPLGGGERAAVERDGEITIRWPQMPRMPLGAGGDRRQHMLLRDPPAAVADPVVALVENAAEPSGLADAEPLGILYDSFTPEIDMPGLEPLSPVVPALGAISPVARVDDSTLEELFEVEDIVDHRVRRVGQRDGGSALQDQFLVRWARYPGEDTWEPRESLVQAPEKLAEAEGRFLHPPGRPPGLYGQDESYDSVDSESVADSSVVSDDTMSDPALLEAALASIQVGCPVGGGLHVDSSGEVWVPEVDPLAAEKLGVTRELRESALDPDTLAQVRQRIELLAMAAKVSPPQRKEYREPRHYYEAITDHNRESWMHAMEQEMGNMADFGVWELVPLPPGKNLMSCKWVYKVKRSIDGGVDRLKARLTCRGFTQKAGVDYDDTWAPTCRMRVFRMLMPEASSDPSYETAQWDCTAAFLHAEVDYEMYMQQAPGFHVGGPHMVYKLKRAIYGCKQSAMLFHNTLRDTLLGLGAKQSRADECLFLFQEGESKMRVLAHVDDLAVVFNDRTLYDKVFAAMQAKFKITDYGGAPISRFVGVCVDRTEEGYYRLHQKPYIEEILQRLGTTEAKHARSPERPGTAAKLQSRRLTPEEAEYMQTVPFREAVGALFYLCRSTRFDIAHAVSEVARFMGNPAPEHWGAVLRIYAYLARTKDVALVMKSSGMECAFHDQFLEGFSDSDWAGCLDTRRSHTGWLVRAGGSLVAWYSKRQDCISQSTTEAEYVAAAAAANEVVWWKRLCEDLGYDGAGPVTVWCDNREPRHSQAAPATLRLPSTFRCATTCCVTTRSADWCVFAGGGPTQCGLMC